MEFGNEIMFLMIFFISFVEIYYKIVNLSIQTQVWIIQTSFFNFGYMDKKKQNFRGKLAKIRSATSLN
jgi:hypothetical protein